MALLDQQPKSGLTGQASNVGVLTVNPFNTFIDTVSKKYNIPREQAQTLVMTAHTDNNTEVDETVESMLIDAGKTGETNASMGPTGTVDLGGWGDFGPTTDAPGRGLMSKAAGLAGLPGGLIGSAYSTGYGAVQTGKVKSGDLVNVGMSLATTLGNKFGIPVSQALGVVSRAASNVRAGMTVEDAMFGAFASYGITAAASMLGASLLGPLGALLGGWAASQIDITKAFEGFSEGMNTWGRDAQATADVKARETLAAMGLAPDLENSSESVRNALATGSYSDIDAADKAVGETESTGYGSYSGGEFGDATTGKEVGGPSVGRGGFGGFNSDGSIGDRGGSGGDSDSGAGSDGVGGKRGSGDEGNSDPGGRGGV